MFSYILTFFFNILPLYCIPVDNVEHISELAFGKPSDRTGKQLLEWNETYEINPEEIGEYLEGDILFPVTKRNGLLSVSARWDNGIIPYDYSGVFTPMDIDMIEKAMAEYHKLTCIK